MTDAPATPAALARHLRQTEGAIIDCKRRLRDRARRGDPLEPVLLQLSQFKREAADLRRAIPSPVPQPQ